MESLKGGAGRGNRKIKINQTGYEKIIIDTDKE